MKPQVEAVYLMDDGATAVITLSVTIETQGMLELLLEGGGRDRLLRYILDGISKDRGWAPPAPKERRILRKPAEEETPF